MPIFTRILTKSEIGSYSNITSWASMLGLIVTLDLASSYTLAKYEYSGKENEYLSSITILGSAIAGFFYIIVCLLQQFFSELFSMPVYALHLFFIYCLFLPAMSNLLVKFRMSYKYKPYIVVSLISSVSVITLSLVLTFIMQDKLFGRVAGTYIPVIILGIIIFIYIMIKGKAKFKPEYCKFALVIALPTLLHSAAGVILNSSDRVMINSMCGPDDTALYSIAYTCGTIISIILFSLNGAWTPWFFDKMNEQKYEEIKKSSIPYTLIFTIIVMGSILIAPEILFVFGGSEYIEAKFVIPPVMGAFLFQFIYTFYVNLEFFKKKNFQIAKASIIATSVNVILNFIFIPVFGYIAAAYTTLAGFILLVLIHYINVRRLNLTFVFNTKYFALILLSNVLFVLLANILYLNDAVRYIFILALFILFIIFTVINRDKVKIHLNFLWKSKNQSK